jgi:hypothetical protein
MGYSTDRGTLPGNRKPAAERPEFALARRDESQRDREDERHDYQRNSSSAPGAGPLFSSGRGSAHTIILARTPVIPESTRRHRTHGLAHVSQLPTSAWLWKTRAPRAVIPIA